MLSAIVILSPTQQTASKPLRHGIAHSPVETRRIQLKRHIEVAHSVRV